MPTIIDRIIVDLHAKLVLTNPPERNKENDLLLINCFDTLGRLSGDDPAIMRHWMHTENLHTGGVPAEQIRTTKGLENIVAYLHFCRGP